MQTAVAAQIALLGSVAALAVFGMAAHTVYLPLWVYLLGWSAFHASEYVITLLYLDSALFLLFGARGSAHLMEVHALSVFEHVLGRKWLGYRGNAVLGGLVVVAGIVVRASAIKTCGKSFNHYIETELPNQLVTWGIYSWCRHPSYLGFLLYVLGMEFVLGNRVSLLLCMVVLFRFFRLRIRYEEYFLVNRLYGAAYVEYMGKVKALVPYVW